MSSAASGVTAVVGNDFGERSLAFVAPDGYTFALVE